MDIELKLAIQAIEVAIKRLKEISYQIRSDKQVEFLNQVLLKLKNSSHE